MKETKNKAAVALGKKRWENKSKKAISEHIKMMNEIRLKKHLSTATLIDSTAREE